MFAQQQMFDRNLSRHVVKTKPMSFFSAFTQSIIFFRKESVLDICPFFVYFYLNCRNDFYLLHESCNNGFMSKDLGKFKFLFN